MFPKRSASNGKLVRVTGVIYLFILQANGIFMVLICEISFIFRVESMNPSIGSYKNNAYSYFSTNESGISEIEDITYMPVIKTLVEKILKCTAN